MRLRVRESHLASFSAPSYYDRMYIEPTPEAGARFLAEPSTGPVTMLNLLRFRDVADYSQSPKLAPETDISGEAAYALYAAHALPFVADAGGEVLYNGRGGPVLIGPSSEVWHQVILVRYPTAAGFFAFVTDKSYRAGLGHRTAALADSRLLPISE